VIVPIFLQIVLEKIIPFAFSVSLISWWPKMFQDVCFLEKDRHVKETTNIHGDIVFLFLNM